MPETVGDALIPEVVRLRLAGKNQREMATALGVSPPTICHTLKRPDVIAQIEEANRESYSLIIQQRGRLALAALERLEKLMFGDADEGKPPPVNDKGDYCVPASVQRQAAADLLAACGITKVVALQFPNGAPGVQLALADLDTDQLKTIAWGDASDAEELSAGRMIDVTPLDEPNEAK